jgi:FkbM family methyltransferase
MTSLKELELYQDIIPKCRMIFDVGVQYESPFFNINPNAEIHLFEPIKECADKLKLKHKNVNCFALGSKEETKNFFWKYGAWKSRPRFDGMQETRKIKIKTINNYCKKEGIKTIDYLKVDTEGFDFEVIKGANLINIKYIQFEDFGTFYNGESIIDIMNYLADYKPYKIGGKPCNYLMIHDNNFQ